LLVLDKYSIQYCPCGFIELWFFGVFPMDKWVAPSRDSLDRMHLTLLTALLDVNFVV